MQIMDNSWIERARVCTATIYAKGVYFKESKIVCKVELM